MVAEVEQLATHDHSHGASAILFMCFVMVFGLFGERRVPYRPTHRCASGLPLGPRNHPCRSPSQGTRRTPRPLHAARRVLKKVPVPYTGLLLIWGLVLGVVDNHVHTGDWETMKAGIRHWAGIHPNLLLAIFLPVLLFASGFSMEWHLVKRLMTQMILLAGPGVVIGTALLALFGKYVYPYGWSWDQAILFGAMFSATDPVAVVALLKEVGAGKDLGTVIEGESLLNDGTAFVFFLLFVDRVKGITSSVGSMVGTFLQLAVGGPAVGAGFGIAQTQLLANIYNDEMGEVSLTVVTSFLTFFVAEDLCRVSGVLAVVALGIYMAAVGKSRISPKSEHALHIVWETLEFFANTLIFVLSGVIIGIEVLKDDVRHYAKDVGYGVLLYLVANAVRFFMVFMMYPILQRSGYGITWKKAVVISWGGLRGAVGLALALILQLDADIGGDYKRVIMLHMGMMAIMTLLINGSLTPLLLGKLGLAETAPAKQRFLDNALHELECIIDDKLQHLRTDDTVGPPNWNEVVRFTALSAGEAGRNMVHDDATIHPSGSTARVAPGSGTAAGRADSAAHAREILSRGMFHTTTRRSMESLVKSAAVRVTENLETLAVKCDKRSLLIDSRQRYLGAVKGVYAEGFEKEYIGAREIGALFEAADTAMDDIESCLDDFTCLMEKELRMPAWLQYSQRVLARVPGGNYVWHRLLYGYISHVVVLTTAFLYAHRQASAAIQSMAERTEGVGHEGEEEAMWEVIGEAEVLCKHAHDFIRGLKCSYPEFIIAVKTKQVARTVLMHKERYVKKLAHAGLVEERELGVLRGAIDAKVSKLMSTRPQCRLPHAKLTLWQTDLFQRLDYATFKQVVLPVASHKVYDKDQTVVTELKPFETPSHVTVVVRGLVSLQSVRDATMQRGKTKSRVLPSKKDSAGSRWKPVDRGHDARESVEVVAPLANAPQPDLNDTQKKKKKSVQHAASFKSDEDRGGSTPAAERPFLSRRDRAKSRAEFHAAEQIGGTMAFPELATETGAGAVPAHGPVSKANSQRIRAQRTAVSRTTFGLEHLLAPEVCEYQGAIQADTVVEVYEIPTKDFMAIMGKLPEIRTAAHQVLAYRLAMRVGPKSLTQYDASRVKEIFNRSIFFQLEKGSTFVPQDAFIIATGAVTTTDGTELPSPGFYEDVRSQAVTSIAEATLVVMLPRGWSQSLSTSAEGAKISRTITQNRMNAAASKALRDLMGATGMKVDNKKMAQIAAEHMGLNWMGNALSKSAKATLLASAGMPDASLDIGTSTPVEGKGLSHDHSRDPLVPPNRAQGAGPSGERESEVDLISPMVPAGGGGGEPSGAT